MTTSEELEEFKKTILADIEEFKLQVLIEACEDRKRLTALEEFAKALYNLLWFRYKNLRMDLEDKVLSRVRSVNMKVDEDKGE